MNDFSKLEAELKKLRPAPVADALWARIERGLGEGASAPTAAILPRPARSGNIWWSLGLGLAGASALILLGLGFFEETAPRLQPALTQRDATSAAPTQPADTGFRPAALTRVVYHRRDEGLVFSPNQSERLLRRVRYDTRETMQWRNPHTGASVRVSYPAEQVVLAPVSFQ